MGNLDGNWSPAQSYSMGCIQARTLAGIRYRLGTMTNDLEPAKKLLDSANYKTLNMLGVMRNVTRDLWKLHTIFRGFGLFDLPMEQLIRQVNMLFQHYHVSTNLRNLTHPLHIFNSNLVLHTIHSL
jgi:hypothetical protein